MLPVLPKPPITPAQKRSALIIAGTVDVLQWALLPTWGLAGAGFFLDQGLDILTVIILLAICGFKWQFALAFFLELIPGVGFLPSWTAFVLTLPSTRAPESTDPRGGGPVRVSPVHPQEQSGSPPQDPQDVEDAVIVPPVQRPPRHP